MAPFVEHTSPVSVLQAAHAHIYVSCDDGIVSDKDGGSVAQAVAVVGGSGFVGRHVVTELVRCGYSPVILSRGRMQTSWPGARRRRCDITAGDDSVRRAIAGCVAVVNASSYVGEDEDLQVRVNVDGVAHVAAAGAEVEAPLVHISTAGVYGTLPFAGGAEGDYLLRPESPLSRTRAQGDSLATAMGASVLRPLFISGSGDTHFLLPLLRAHVVLGAWIEDGAAQLSVASAELVASAAVATVKRRLGGGSPELVHVVSDRPVAVRELVAEILGGWGVPPDRSVSADQAVERLASFGLSERKVRQLTRDYFISSSLMQHLVPDAAECSRPVTAAAHAWYRDQRSHVLGR